MKDQLKFTRNIAWKQVWDSWKEREEEIWRPVFENLGLTWEEWRKKYIEPFSLNSRNWSEYIVFEPELFIPNMYIGGFKGWKKYLSNTSKSIKFSDLIKNIEVGKNKKVKSLLGDFPSITTIIAIKYKNEFVLLEGMHRCSAISIAASRGQSLAKDISLHLIELDQDEEDLFNLALINMPAHEEK